MADKRIGLLNTDGSVKAMPEVSISGNSYDNAQDRLGIGKGQFVILDRGLSSDVRDILVSALLASTKETPKTKAIDNEP